MTSYPALIDGQPGAYGVVFPDLDGVVAMGATLDEAILNAKESLRDYALDTERDGDFVATPTAMEHVEVPAGSTLTSIPLIRAIGKAARANKMLNANVSAIKARIDAGEETWPQELVDALLAGENPIRVFRKHRAMTVAVLAQQTGLSQPYISELENGKKSPSVKALQAIASALAVDLDDITS